MTSTCPNGHTSAADDYCDVCGAPIDSAQQAAPTPPAQGAASAAAASPTPIPSSQGSTSSSTSAAPAASGPNLCPHCGTENVPEALFCEACGYDFTTGTLPRSDAAESPEAGVNTAQAASQATTGVPASAGAAPAEAGFRFVAEVWVDPAWYEAQQASDPLPSPGLPEVVPLRKPSVLIGRVSRSRNIHPDIDCEPDSGASRRQAQLTTDGTRWWVEDLESANGTFVAGSTDPLPDNPIAVGLKQEIQPGDRIYVGAWTRIVVREATPEEQESLV